MKIPRPLSPGEESFVMQCKVYKIPFEREVEFCPGRKWRADFLIKHAEATFLIEIDGGTKFGQSAHSKGAGYESDCRKANTANLMGFTCLKFTTAMILSGEAIDLIRECFSDSTKEETQTG